MRSRSTTRGSFSCPGASLRKTTSKRYRASMYPSGCSTVRPRATPAMRLPAAIHTRPRTRESRRQNSSMSTAPAASPLRRCRWTPPASCRTITWTPSSPITTRSCSSFPRPIFRAFSQTGSMFRSSSAGSGRTSAARAPLPRPCAAPSSTMAPARSRS